MKLIDLINKCTVEQIAECWQKIHPDEEGDINKLIASLHVAIDDLKNAGGADVAFRVERFDDAFNVGDSYINVSLINKNFVKEPPSGLKHWGGNDSDEHDCPEGYYNANWIGYYPSFGIGRDWGGFINGEIVVDENASDLTELEILTEILWEITFYGFSCQVVEKFWDTIDERMEECKAEISKKKQSKQSSLT